MPPRHVKTLSDDDVRFIHQSLVADFARSPDPIHPAGVKSENLLASAVSRQHTSMLGVMKYPDPITNAATLTYGICCDHPFHNGNKRAALVAMLAHLDRNKLTLPNTSNEDLYAMILAVANHTLVPDRKKSRLFKSRPKTDDEITQLAKWIRQRSQKVTRGEAQITYRELNPLLDRFGYALRYPKGNSISVVRYVKERQGMFRPKVVIVEKHIGSIPYPGDNAVVPISILKELRTLCRLREEDGCDREAFYGQGPVINEFINRYRTILRKLANK